MRTLVLVTVAIGLALVASSAGADGVNIGITVGAPPPPPPHFVVAAPPRLVVVPHTPVFYAPRLSINLFSYGGQYYTYDRGAWFTSPYYTGPWSFVPLGRVPLHVRGVPVAYYRVPPGHLKHRHW